MFENLPNIKALNFFDIEMDLFKLSKKSIINKKYLLFSFSKLLNEESFAKVYAAWEEKGLHFVFDVNHSFLKAKEDYSTSDSIEIFIDTRSLKTKGYLTKFCHHFVFYPTEVGKYKAKEVTRFKSDDTRPLCEGKDLVIDSIIKQKSYMLKIFIPLTCLEGYNPMEIKFLSLAYKINRCELSPQHFSISSFEHVIEKSPYLWPQMRLS